jgi:osmotically-inducible protein OsmY
MEVVMQRSARASVTRRAAPWVVGIAAAAALGIGCGGARPYRAMAKAASSEENAFSQAADDRTKIRLREALLTSGSSVHITPYVYMGHAFLVGTVANDADRDKAVAAAQAVGGVRSVDTYLPTTAAPSSGGAVSGKVDDVALEAEVKAALAEGGNKPTQIDVAVVDGHVVLLGVVASADAIQTATASAQGVSGVTGVTSFLLLPEEGYERLRPSLR